MELRQLEYFQMVARYRNITRAATHLNVSQPNITVSIKKLENELEEAEDFEEENIPESFEEEIDEFMEDVEIER